jgi:hypothetical protein
LILRGCNPSGGIIKIGMNYVVANDVDRPDRRSFGNSEVIRTDIGGLTAALQTNWGR